MTPTCPADARSRLARWAPALILGGAGMAAYANSLRGPFLLDDAWNILRNPSIRHLGRLGAVLAPPADLGVGGRPLYNLSFALNYAVGGTAPLGYHLVNLAIHLLAALTLYGIVRQTFAPRPAEASPLALACAALWLLHPLQTASVTYVSQRSEELMGLFYLLTLYCFIRSAAPGGPARGWTPLAIACCLLGTAAKEVMVTAPALVLLYDRTFVSGSFRAALRRHARLYAGLATSWVLLALLMLGARRHGVGYGLGASAGSYALTECRAIAGYLRLAAWPHPLVFDYDLPLVRDWRAVAGDGLLLGAAAAAALACLWLRPAIGFAACAFFLLLFPTSSIVPVAGQPMAENRMYLPLAALAVLAVVAIRAVAGRRAWLVLLALALAAGALTVRRNRDFASDLAIWRDTIAKCPASARAHSSLGVALYRHGDRAAALAEVAEAVRLRPDSALDRLLLGNLLADGGRGAAAAAQYREALRLDPGLTPARAALDRLAR